MRLDAVRIPTALRGFAEYAHDDVFDVLVQDSRVAAIAPSAAPARGILLSAPVEAHVHLDKTYTAPEAGAAQGDLFAAIARSAAHRAGWTESTLERRMQRALAACWRSGVRALRTHLDWPDAEPPLALRVFERLRAQWAGRIELQFAALTPLDRFADPAAGERIARAVQRAGGVLGAFVYRNDALDARLERVFALAAAHGLALDFHVDEGLDQDARGLERIARLALVHQAVLHGRVVCGHACSLAMQPAAQADATLALCARAGIHLVALPTTNLYLQGAWDGTPVPRGITRIREAAAHGLRASLATDNVQDPFYPYGGYDPIDVFALGVQVAHLAPAIAWLDTITVNPARALGLAWDGRIAPGCPADLVLLAARDEHELIGPHARRRRVIRGGRPIDQDGDDDQAQDHTTGAHA